MIILHCLNKLNQTKNKEPDMKNKILKLVVAYSLFVLVFSGLSCDDRKASSTVSEEGLTLTFIKSQPVASGATVGEAVVAYSGVYIIVELRDEDGQPVKNGIVSFSANVLDGASPKSYGSFDVSIVPTDSDGRAFVTYSANSGTGAVDDPTTPKYENVEVVATLEVTSVRKIIKAATAKIKKIGGTVLRTLNPSPIQTPSPLEFI